MKEYLKLSNEEIIKRYKRLSQELGVIPGKKEIELCEFLCSYSSIINSFGSLQELRRQCGIFHPAEQSGKPLKDIIEKVLIRLRVERGRRLDYIDIFNNKELPRYEYIRRIYDNKPISEIWNIIEERIPNSLALWKK